MAFAAGGAAPWLPPAESHRPLAVDRQAGQADSLLSHYQRLLHWRKTQPALLHGSLSLGPAHPQVLTLLREHDGQRLLCAFNFSGQPAELALPQAAGPVLPLDPTGGQAPASASLQAGRLQMAPWGWLFARLG